MATRKKDPTLQDIWQKLGSQDEKLDQIHGEVRYTNGRVTKLEKWKAKADVIADYLKEHPAEPAKTYQEKAEGWTIREKQLIAIIMALIALVGAAVGTGKL